MLTYLICYDNGSLETDSRLRVRITDADHRRWEVPQDVVPRPALGPQPKDFLLNSPGNPSMPSNSTMSSASSDLAFTIHASPFRFTVSRRSTGDTLFDTSANLVFKDRYVTSVPCIAIYVIWCSLIS